MLIRCYKTLSLICLFLWTGLGVITIGSIALSVLSWGVNLFMGVLFILIGGFLYLRAFSFWRGYAASVVDTRNNLYIQRFLLLDLVLMVGACFVGGVLVMASISRVFGEGFAVFG